MTAGSGLLHIEAQPEWLVAKGGLFHGVQLWVNLPRTQKLATPRYQDLRSGELGLVTTPDAGVLLRVIAGDVAGQVGPGSTHTPMAMVHATLAPGARLELPWQVEFNGLVYVLAGQGRVGMEGRPIRAGQLAVLGAGDFVSVAADERQESRSPNLEVLVLGGRPIREPVAWAGPFVMNTKAEVMQAYEDFQKGRMGQIPAVHGAPTELQQG
jgi:redox-sensitive bicupin YhaK (pirin superfamily)